jgi:hypothetical protein
LLLILSFLYLLFLFSLLTHHMHTCMDAIDCTHKNVFGILPLCVCVCYFFIYVYWNGYVYTNVREIIRYLKINHTDTNTHAHTHGCVCGHF